MQAILICILKYLKFYIIISQCRVQHKMHQILHTNIFQLNKWIIWILINRNLHENMNTVSYTWYKHRRTYKTITKWEDKHIFHYNLCCHIIAAQTNYDSDSSMCPPLFWEELITYLILNAPVTTFPEAYLFYKNKLKCLFWLIKRLVSYWILST